MKCHYQESGWHSVPEIQARTWPILWLDFKRQAHAWAHRIRTREWMREILVVNSFGGPLPLFKHCIIMVYTDLPSLMLGWVCYRVIHMIFWITNSDQIWKTSGCDSILFKPSKKYLWSIQSDLICCVVMIGVSWYLWTLFRIWNGQSQILEPWWCFQDVQWWGYGVMF